MNCEDVTGILDNQRLDTLNSERRRQAEAHVAVCAECARAWNLQTGLAALPDMALPADFAARCRVLVAAGAAPAGRRGARRIWLLGAVASLAAVAVALVLLLRPTAVTVPQATVRAAEVSTPPHVVETLSAASVPGITPAAVVETAPEPRFTVRLIPYQAPTEAPVAADDPGLVREMSGMQKRANDSDPAREQALPSLYTALIEEFHKVPGLSLVASDPTDSSPSRKHFRVKISPVMMLGMDNRPAPINSRYLMVALSAEELRPGGKSINRRAPSPGQIDLQANCSGAASAGDAPPCRDVRGVAAALVQALIKDVFPPSASVTRPLQAKFRDAALDMAQRLQALDELFKLQGRLGDGSLLSDPGVVRAAIAMAATADPVLRARIWRSLRGTGNPELIQPMLASLAQDPDDVRLAAIETLSADFPGDPRVRSALEATAQGDQRPLVRAVAERGLAGEAKWRQYVVASLKDPTVQAPQRVEALVYLLYPPGPTPATTPTMPDYFQVMQELLDDDAVRALAEAIPDSGGLGMGGNNLLGNFAGVFSKNPAIPEMLLRVLEHDSKPLMRAVAAQHLARMNASEPRVREALAKALDSDPDARVRDTIRGVMGNKFP